MSIANKQEPLILLFGDILLFVAALWITLFIRYAEVPSDTLFYNHIIPFSVLFVVWVVVFFIAGLYGKHTTLLRSKVPSIILNAQGVNIIIAALFFFFFPFFGIAPKTNLVLYLVISSLFILLWRTNIFPKIGFRKKQKAIVIGYKEEVEELVKEINRNPRYNLEFISTIAIDEPTDIASLQREGEVSNVVNTSEVSVVVVDTKSRKVGEILEMLRTSVGLRSEIEFLDIHTVYESVFDRVPLSALNETWVLENISTDPKWFYDTVKRIVDVVLAVSIGVVSLVVYPFVYLAIKLEDGGRACFSQARVGKDNQQISITKFRSMSGVDTGKQVLKSKSTVTRVGNVLRKTRIDELPQVWNVLKGGLSFIGPRPEIGELVSHYADQIPYYNVRHVIKPGLTGWAQIRHEGHPHHGADVFETKRKLSYDLYYIKERSILFDLYIGLQTIKTIISRGGR